MGKQTDKISVAAATSLQLHPDSSFAHFGQ
jgi:hypothetical protein